MKKKDYKKLVKSDQQMIAALDDKIGELENKIDFLEKIRINQGNSIIQINNTLNSEKTLNKELTSLLVKKEEEIKILKKEVESLTLMFQSLDFLYRNSLLIKKTVVKKRKFLGLF